MRDHLDWLLWMWPAPWSWEADGDPTTSEVGHIVDAREAVAIAVIDKQTADHLIAIINGRATWY